MRGNVYMVVVGKKEICRKSIIIFLLCSWHARCYSPSEQEKSVCMQDWVLPVNRNRFNFSPERPSFLTREQFIQTSFSALR